MDMSLSRRKCVTYNEDLKKVGIDMEAFVNYSRPSCLLECRAKLLFEQCGCLPYFYPDFATVWHKNHTDCNDVGLKCLAERAGDFKQSQLRRVS